MESVRIFANRRVIKRRKSGVLSYECFGLTNAGNNPLQD